MPPERLMEDTPMKLEEYVSLIQSFGDRFLFLGDGMPVHRAKLQELLGDAAVFAAPQHAYLRPASVAALGERSKTLLDYTELMPMYLRAPSAERNKKLMEAANGK
jgi:tRNA threonylcarbamoyladenosine biosynthesis protein TsaB